MYRFAYVYKFGEILRKNHTVSFRFVTFSVKLALFTLFDSPRFDLLLPFESKRAA